MNRDFKGKVVLVMSISNSEGLSIAKEFAKAGSQLIIADIDDKRLKYAKKKLEAFGKNIKTYKVDISKELEVKSMVNWVKQEFAGINILVNNFKVSNLNKTSENPISKLNKIFNLNFMETFKYINGFLPLIVDQDNAQIINIANGKTSYKFSALRAYLSVKLSMEASSKVLSFELNKYDIKVTTIYPFYSKTPQKIGKMIFNSVKSGRSFDPTSIFNDMGVIVKILPTIANSFSYKAKSVLRKKFAVLTSSVIIQDIL